MKRIHSPVHTDEPYQWFVYSLNIGNRKNKIFENFIDVLSDYILLQKIVFMFFLIADIISVFYDSLFKLFSIGDTAHAQITSFCLKNMSSVGKIENFSSQYHG